MDSVTIGKIKQGVGAGLVAGVLFAIAEILAAASAGDPALTPFPMFASIVVGAEAFAQLPLWTTVLIGSVVHFALSALFGVIYSFVAARSTRKTVVGWRRHALLGAGYGFVLWLVNFQIIGSIAYPWFAETHTIAQIIVHTVFFGLPLGLLFVATERGPGREPLDDERRRSHVRPTRAA